MYIITPLHVLVLERSIWDIQSCKTVRIFVFDSDEVLEFVTLAASEEFSLVKKGKIDYKYNVN